MIIGGSKKPIIANIRQNLATGELNKKVEIGDPDLSDAELKKVLDRFFKNKLKKSYKLKNQAAAALVRQTAKEVEVELLGLENLKPSICGKLSAPTPVKSVENSPKKSSGAILTSNHFNPLDSYAARAVADHLHKKLFIVVQDANLAMPGNLGFLFNNLDVLPLSKSPHYITQTFLPELQKLLKAGHLVLIYPEEEMWFNYRKPRPCKRGAYQFAHQLGAPILPLFVEIREQAEIDNDEFYKTKYLTHILEPIFPDPTLTPRSDSKRLAALDYRQKIAAYESAYHQNLTYNFSPTDIAGWRLG